jgi:hypothetical protein
MKKALILLAIIFAIVSCSKDEKPSRFRLDSSAMIYIKPNQNSNSKKLSFSGKYSSEHLSNLEIVKLGTTMRFYNDSLSNNECVGGFAGKDTISAVPAFLRYGTDIINENGFGKPYLVPDFIYAYDIVIEIFKSNTDHDTIAYIPNAVIENARLNIKAALAAKDTASVYTIFNSAFTFIPITGSEYRELKRQNLN